MSLLLEGSATGYFGEQLQFRISRGHIILTTLQIAAILYPMLSMGVSVRLQKSVFIFAIVVTIFDTIRHAKLYTYPLP